MSDNRFVPSTLCYVRHAGKTLMLHRVKRDRDIHQDKWNGLGGKLHAGETPEECVVREVYEESGLKIREPRLRGIMTFPDFKAREDWLVFLFTADQFDGKPKAECDEGLLEWIEDGRITDLPLWEGDKYFLDWLKKPEFFSARFVYRDKKLVQHEVQFYG